LQRKERKREGREGIGHSAEIHLNFENSKLPEKEW
jgi:hypothetical protein